MPKKLLLISQVFVPDPAAVGQQMADAAEEMAARGWDVRVLTADRGYDNPEQKFAKHEERNGVKIRRLPFSSLGKKSIKQRLIGQCLFCLQAFLHGLFMRNLDVVLVTTSPPMGSAVAVALKWLRRGKVKFWVMDINPDQVIVQNILPKTHPMVRAFDWLNRRALSASSDVVVLDRFMGGLWRRRTPPRLASITRYRRGRWMAILSALNTLTTPFARNMVSKVNLSSCTPATTRLSIP